MKPCNQCGKCCLRYGNGGLGSATIEEMETWKERAPQVLYWVDPDLGDMWINPRTGEETDRCPWLRKLPGKQQYKCQIHDVKPCVCRRYPVCIDQMIKDQCEMLEADDLLRPAEQVMADLRSLQRNSPGIKTN